MRGEVGVMAGLTAAIETTINTTIDGAIEGGVVVVKAVYWRAHISLV